MNLAANSIPRTHLDRFEVRNPSNNEIIGLVANQSVSELDKAVAKAKRAFKTWSRQPDDTRKQICLKIAEKITAHREELAIMITQEQGKPLSGLGSRWEVGGASAWAAFTGSLELPITVLQDDETGKVELERKAIGVVGSITPWNFPLLIAVWHILPAIRAGNTVVIKPSPNTPLATLRFVELLNEIVPEGVVNCITSDDKVENLGAAMSAHPDIGKIVFTGSCDTGKKVMRSAAQTMKRITLELGGNDAGIVLPDCNIDESIEKLFWSAFINNGQTCAALKRLYVHNHIHDELVEKLFSFAQSIPVGDGMDEGNLLGPIQNRMQFNKVSQLMAALPKSAVVRQCEHKNISGLFFSPTLVMDVTNADQLVEQEQFGPVLPIIRYKDVDQAIVMANQSDNGLGGSVWSRCKKQALHIARQLECGSVWINNHGAIQPNAPFGGVKSSGLGRQFALDGLHEFTETQVIFS